MEHIIQDIREMLLQLQDEKNRDMSRHFFKEKVTTYGVKTNLVTQIAKVAFQHIKDCQKQDIFDLCDSLWQSGVLEESFVACHWSFMLRKQYLPEDFVWFEKWISHDVSNWASCDSLCNHSVGTFIERYPDFISRLKTMTRNENRWVRRASAVTLILPAKKGLFLNDIFEIADSLLADRDDLVQKGYGWMLKAASQAHQDEVFTYVSQRKAIMPRTALRYAIEKMPPELKAIAMSR